MGQGLTRLQGWEQRLPVVLEEARSRPYQLGRHDCFRVALLAVEALTGVAWWPAFEGRYGTRREAIQLMANFPVWSTLVGRPVDKAAVREMVERRGSVFDAVFSHMLGGDPAPMAQARRGDICKYSDVMPHLGVCNGATVAVLKDKGLAFVPLDACQHCWRIG